MHFRDTVYYPILEATVGRPYALYVHGDSDTTGAVRGVETIATGLRWKRLREPLSIVGEVDAAGREACWDLGATVAASLIAGDLDRLADGESAAGLHQRTGAWGAMRSPLWWILVWMARNGVWRW